MAPLPHLILPLCFAPPKRSLLGAVAGCDYMSVPQVARATQGLAIDSLCTYAFLCSAFIVVAPKVMHTDTGVQCDAESYRQRAWCRAEQLACFMNKGIDSMYLADGKGVPTPLTQDWVKLGTDVFHGNLTCCTRKHQGMVCCDRERLVMPLLGLFGAAYAQRADPVYRPSYELLMSTPDMFPRTFATTYTLPNGKEMLKTKPLFDDLIDRMKDYVHNNEGLAGSATTLDERASKSFKDLLDLTKRDQRKTSLTSGEKPAAGLVTV